MDDAPRPTPNEPPAAGPPPGGKDPVDMATLMMELARIRREVESGEPERKGRGVAAWVVGTLVAAALLGLLSRGPCRPAAGERPGAGVDQSSSGSMITTPRSGDG